MCPPRAVTLVTGRGYGNTRPCDSGHEASKLGWPLSHPVSSVSLHLSPWGPWARMAVQGPLLGEGCVARLAAALPCGH